MEKKLDTVWAMEPHTVGKHKILKEYLQAWLRILAQRNTLLSELLIIDGFAGPGIYQDGEIGSPIIILETIRTFKEEPRFTDTKVDVVLIEEDSKRFAVLVGEIQSRQFDAMPGLQLTIINDSFDGQLDQILSQRSKWATPCFAMIDPFGIRGVSIDHIANVMTDEMSEVYITYMQEFVNRFRGHAHFEEHLNSFLGSDEWKSEDSLLPYYAKCLRSAGCKHVLSFDLYQGNKYKYSIYHGTKSLRGCERMKQAIWKHCPMGDFKFVGSNLSSLGFGVDESSISELIWQQLLGEFGGKEVAFKTVERFMQSDQTPFHPGQLTKYTLVPKEKEGVLVVNRPNGAGRSMKKAGTKLVFPSPHLNM